LLTRCNNYSSRMAVFGCFHIRCAKNGAICWMWAACSIRLAWMTCRGGRS